MSSTSAFHRGPSCDQVSPSQAHPKRMSVTALSRPKECRYRSLTEPLGKSPSRQTIGADSTGLTIRHVCDWLGNSPEVVMRHDLRKDQRPLQIEASLQPINSGELHSDVAGRSSNQLFPPRHQCGSERTQDREKPTRKAQAATNIRAEYPQTKATFLAERMSHIVSQRCIWHHLPRSLQLLGKV